MTSIVAATTADAPDILHAPSVNEQGRGVNSRVKAFSGRSLTKSFAKASLGAGAMFAIKASAVGAATSAGSGVALAALTGGLVSTGYGAVRDFRAERSENPQAKSGGIFDIIKSFFSFLWQNKGKYAGKLAVNSGFALLGAGVVEYFNDVAIGEAAAQTLDAELPQSAALEPEAAPERVEEAAISAPEALAMEPVSSPLDTLSSYDPTEFEGRAAEILPYALNGDAWAVKEMAAELLYQNNGAPMDKKLAVELYQMTLNSDVPSVAAQAQADLDYVDTRWGLDTIIESQSETLAEAEAPASHIEEPLGAPEVLTPLQNLAALENLNGQALALQEAALAGDRQAIGDAGIGMLNGWYGFEADPEQGLALIKDAAEKGSEWHQLQMAMLEHGSGAPFGVEANPESAIGVITELAQSSQTHVAAQAQDFLEKLAPGESLEISDTQQHNNKALTLPELGNAAAACDTTPENGGLNVLCQFNEDLLATGNTVSLPWGALGDHVDFSYVSNAQASIDIPLAEEKSLIIPASFTHSAIPVSEPVNCFVNNNDGLVELACRFTEEARAIRSPVLLDIPQSTAQFSLTFDTQSSGTPLADGAFALQQPHSGP